MQKQIIINACHNYFKNKVNSLNTIINEVNESANSESKSSAGDKHETAKAMMQLEREKLGTQLKEAEEQLAEFEMISFNKTFQKIEQGSLIQTDKGYFFIAGSVGKLIVDKQILFVISNKSPLAIKLIGQKQSDTVLFNDVAYLIISIQ